VAKFVHPMALCESEMVGDGTRIWAFAHVMRGAAVGADCNIGEGAFVESGATIGDRVTLKNQVMVWDGVRIGDDAFIGPGVIFTNDRAPRSARMPRVAARYSNPDRWRLPTTIGRGASLGAGAVILPSLNIGACAMVGAGAVVTHDVAPHRLVAGNPARPIGWVCACGGRLDHGPAWTCTECAATYRMTDDGLCPQSAEP
jgi:UDP-2-acetamido-3-amino-2,3-dideoxy-glucuronate N-acetyltransferase